MRNQNVGLMTILIVVVLGKPGGSMSEKYYIVSEDELQNLSKYVSVYVTHLLKFGIASANTTACTEAETACRARPFEKYQAVVEAAKEVANIKYGLNGNYLIDELRKALTALEEEV
jgi:hypothetical protein